MRALRIGLIAWLLLWLIGAVPGRNVVAAPLPRPLGLIGDNLIAYWKLEEASGTRLDELTGCGGSGCDLTDTNTVTGNPGKLGDAAQFTAANSEYLTRADHADLSAGDINLSFQAWVYLDNKTATRTILAKRGNSASLAEYVLRYQQDIDRFVFLVGDGTSTNGTVAADNFGAPSATTWYHLVAWHDATNNQIGIAVNDGTPNTTAWTTGVLDGTAAFQLGRQDTLFYMQGRIDSVGFWKRVLTSGERTCLYNSGNGLEYPFATCDATATPTNTHTFTPTITDTPTVTHTFTPTITNTPTITHTPTVTNTDEPGPTDTPTVTATDTDTATATVTHTPADTATPTATATPVTPVGSAVCADSFVFPLDTGNDFTVDLCSDVDGIVAGTGIVALVIVTVLIFMYSRVRSGL